MAKNPYSVLGLTASASDSEIRAAFRKLAKQYHPDRNPDDKAAEEKFKEISAAFDIVGDADKRKRFDRGEIDAEGRERGFAGGGYGGARPGGFGGGAYGSAGGPGAGASFEDLGDIFSDLFGGRRANAMRGRDLRYRLEVDFLDAALGAKKRVTMPDGRNLDLTVPAGLEDGQTLRLRGQGEPGHGGAPAGDVYVEVKVKPHRQFERKGDDIHVEAPIGLAEAVLGGKVTVPTISGDVSVTAPKNASSGTVLRLKGRGIKKSAGVAGDQYVKLKIVLPEGGDKELEAFVRRWKPDAAAKSRTDAESV
ncbi:MAG: DnaJ C-terminal domain-containing protein [Pseudomonadota bacterium]